ncbi:unnamed protein product [Larinioides sclopetarius]|uniref:Uncharacterized protein n=1 Tax=Larinioides sclopetarius TaxID=280406 RepID=A0AAV1Z9J9_9ARAC
MLEKRDQQHFSVSRVCGTKYALCYSMRFGIDTFPSDICKFDVQRPPPPGSGRETFPGEPLQRGRCSSF